MKIEVTQKHIDKGGYGSFNSPVSLAVQESLGQPNAEIIGCGGMMEGDFCYFEIWIRDEFRAYLPDSVRKFFERWDNFDLDVQPFSFEIQGE